jgi:hypothetical protein
MTPRRLSVAVFGLLLLAAPAAADEAAWWPAEVEQALGRAGDNRPELVKALNGAAADQRAGMAFLVANMPDRDLRALRADFLLENVALAYQARRQAPWGKQVPEEVFLNDVLPYANVDEARDPWRKELSALCRPLVEGCKTPGEAAQRLNSTVFGKVQVRYSTERTRPHLSPKEAMEQGKCSCTGLSILLADACRSVGVPARLVGTPMWANKRGNHTWVEVWDGGWHFVGAAEPDPKGLDRAWFVGDAAKAKKGTEHAIYAVSFRRTGVSFPLVWAPQRKDVWAEDVSDRYARANAPGAKPETAKSAGAVKDLKAALEAHPDKLAEIADAGFANVPLAREDAAAARELLWAAHVALVKKDRAAEVKDRLIKEDKLEMPFSFKTFGKKPKDGWSLYISLHGGGGAPKQVNDSQWENQKKLYTVEEGIYLAPRAPTNTWNLWHEAHIDRMFARLIEDLIVLEEVNPNRVYVLGYSAGGDGVYKLAPRMADHWAGAAMMAGHPNGVSLLSLRNVPFALQVGGNDAAYNRNKVGREYGEILDKLHKDDPKGYEHFVKIHEGKGHWMNLEDKAALPWMAKFTRDPIPDRVVWKQTDVAHDRSYWLAVPTKEAQVGSLVIATRSGQTIEITAAEKVTKLTVRLSDRMVDLDRPVVVKQGEKTLFSGTAPRTVAALVKTLMGRGDPGLVFDAEVEVTVDGGK